jgi:hypothetical protein
LPKSKPTSAPAPTYIYTFTGEQPEEFPCPPLVCVLQPGQRVETTEPVEHARLVPVTGDGAAATTSSSDSAPGTQESE